MTCRAGLWRSSAAVPGGRPGPLPGPGDGRAAGHFDADRTDDDLWHSEVNEPVAGGWPVVEVATDRPVDLAVLQDRLGTLAAR